MSVPKIIPEYNRLYAFICGVDDMDEVSETAYALGYRTIELCETKCGFTSGVVEALYGGNRIKVDNPLKHFDKLIRADILSGSSKFPGHSYCLLPLDGKIYFIQSYALCYSVRVRCVSKEEAASIVWKTGDVISNWMDLFHQPKPNRPRDLKINWYVSDVRDFSLYGLISRAREMLSIKRLQSDEYTWFLCGDLVGVIPQVIPDHPVEAARLFLDSVADL